MSENKLTIDNLLIDFQAFTDVKGSLLAFEQNKNIPFDIARVYFIYDVDNAQHRGFHAHKELEQVALCLKGSCIIVMDQGDGKRMEVRLNSPRQGIYIPPGVWHEMYDFSQDCVFTVFASDYYDESDYIREYNDFLKWKEHSG